MEIKDHSDGITILDLTFWLNKLRENGFNVKEQKIELDEKLIPDIKVEEVRSLWTNGIMDILFIKTNSISRNRLARADRNYIKRIPFRIHIL